MKIVQIITRLNFGGSSENLIDLCRKLKDDGFDVILVYGGDEIKQFDFKYYYLKELKREIGLLDDIKVFLKIIKILFREKPYVINTHTSKAGVIGRWAGFFYKLLSNKNTKIIHVPHGHIFYGYFSKPKTYFFIILEFLTSFITDFLVALTENEKMETLKYGIGKEKKWHIIPSGVDYFQKLSGKDIREEFKIPKEKIVVGSVARLEPIKGIDYLIRSVKYLNEILKIKNIKDFPIFLIVGDGSQKDYLKKIADEDKVKEHIIFAGYREDVYDLINVMDIYVQPSLNEGMGRTVVMAEILSKPIIASSVCGLKDLITDAYNGYLVEPKNSLELAMKIYELFKNEDLRKNMGQKSFELVNREENGFKYYSFEREYLLYKKLYMGA